MALTSTQLSDYFNSHIKKNGRQQITGSVMNYALHAIKDYIDAIPSSNIGTSDLLVSSTSRRLKLSGTDAINYFTITSPGGASEWFTVNGIGEMIVKPNSGWFSEFKVKSNCDVTIYSENNVGIYFMRFGTYNYVKEYYDGYRALEINGHEKLVLKGGGGYENIFIELNKINTYARDFNQSFSYNFSDFKFQFNLNYSSYLNEFHLNHGGAYGNVMYIGKGQSGNVPSAISGTFACFAREITTGYVAPHFKCSNGDVIKIYKQSISPASVADINTVLTNLGLL